MSLLLSHRLYNIKCFWIMQRTDPESVWMEWHNLICLYIPAVWATCQTLTWLDVTWLHPHFFIRVGLNLVELLKLLRKRDMWAIATLKIYCNVQDAVEKDVSVTYFIQEFNVDLHFCFFTWSFHPKRHLGYKFKVQILGLVKMLPHENHLKSHRVTSCSVAEAAF